MTKDKRSFDNTPKFDNKAQTRVSFLKDFVISSQSGDHLENTFFCQIWLTC
jgi:hypothetical protein